MSTKIISSFICCGEHMIIVKLEHGVHVMSYDEWEKVYEKLYPDRWDRGRRLK